MTKLKICGCKSLNDIAIVNKYQPDYVGFVFAESKRRVDADYSKLLKRELSIYIKAVGVFVNEPLQNIENLCKEHIIDVVQLHGDETENYIKNLKERIKQPIIKAVRVQSKEQVLYAKELPCDYLLFDTCKKGVYGGSGEIFDWNMIPELSKPFFLAGGLGSENILNAIDKCKPYAIDVSSGVEVEGQKDENKIREISRQIKELSINHILKKGMKSEYE